MRILCKVVYVVLFAAILSPSLAQGQNQINTVPLIRLRNAAGWHVFTADQSEVAKISGEGWKFEATAGYVFPQQVPGTTPLYRRDHPTNGDHLYTISSQEATDLKNINGYKDGGIAGYVATEQVPGTLPFRRLNHSQFGHLYTTDIDDAANARAIGYREEAPVGYIWTGPTSFSTATPIPTPTLTPIPTRTESPTPTPKSGDDGGPNWPVIATAIATLLTAIAAVIAAIRRGDKKQD